MKVAVPTSSDDIPWLLRSRKDTKKLNALLQPMRHVGAYKESVENKIKVAARSSAGDIVMTKKKVKSARWAAKAAKEAKAPKASAPGAAKSKAKSAAKSKSKAASAVPSRDIQADTLTFKDMENSLNYAIKNIPQDCNQWFDNNRQEVRRKMARLLRISLVCGSLVVVVVKHVLVTGRHQTGHHRILHD